MADPQIRFDRVTKNFGSLCVVDDLNFTIQRGEFVSLLGPSGSGKTTILMMLAGFVKPSSGAVWIDGRRIDHLPPHRRNMGVVFQSYALFPHMSVAENVAFPLRMRKVAKPLAAEKVARVLDMVQLGALRDRRPSQLSGGQQQRVALARALIFEPSVILMDEPLSALDKQLREQMQLDIRDLHRRLGLTVVFVTHDQSEAMTMSDRIAVFNGGKIEQHGTPREIYDRPHTRFTAEFMGETNLVQGVVKGVSGHAATVECEGGREIVVEPSDATSVGRQVVVSIRPERIHLGPQAGEAANTFKSAVVDSVYQGNHLRMQLDEGALGFFVRSDRRVEEFRPGDPVYASFRPADCWVVAL